MIKLILIAIGLCFCFSSPLNGQYEIIKYQFSDHYENDKNYQRCSEKVLELVQEVNELRDSIIHSKRMPEQDKLYSLQLVNQFLTDPESVLNIMIQNEDLFPWYKVQLKEDVDDLIHTYSSAYFYRALIKDTYLDLNSNVFLKNSKDASKKVKGIIKYLGFDNNKYRQSIFLRNVYGMTRADKCFRNKDIYFSALDKDVINKIIWSQQYYASRKFKKRGNSYFGLRYDDSIIVSKPMFDYVIEVMPSNSIVFHTREFEMLKLGGRFYIEIDFRTKQEHKEHIDHLIKMNIDNPDRVLKFKSLPHIDRSTIESFVSKYDIQIESEVEEEDYVKYIFRKG